MATKNRTPMPVSERAKQFMPFAALKGYEEALRAKEREVEQNAEGTKENYGRGEEICDID